MLQRFRQAQMSALEKLRELEQRGCLPSPFTGPRPSLAARLLRDGPGAVIAEYKRASPSQGDINLTHSPEEIAQAYARAGASALSVLTEQAHFKGELGYLWRMAAPGLPLLRKDFLIHPLQVAETAATPASALLLIVRLLSREQLALMLQAAGQAGLEAVLEIFNPAELEQARAAGAECQTRPLLIQVNTRDLATLTVDSQAAERLIGGKRQDEIWICASGIKERSQVEGWARLGFDAVLAGTSLMSAPDPGAALADLTGLTGLFGLAGRQGERP
jgi:indole-3-glycerol phosphate synthase